MYPYFRKPADVTFFLTVIDEVMINQGGMTYNRLILCFSVTFSQTHGLMYHTGHGCEKDKS